MNGLVKTIQNMHNETKRDLKYSKHAFKMIGVSIKRNKMQALEGCDLLDMDERFGERMPKPLK